jgi:hypothetical protein
LLASRTRDAGAKWFTRGGAGSNLRRAIILSMVAATLHGVDIVDVWRRVRRFRGLTRSVPEQLKLPLD